MDYKLEYNQIRVRDKEKIEILFNCYSKFVGSASHNNSACSIDGATGGLFLLSKNECLATLDGA